MMTITISINGQPIRIIKAHQFGKLANDVRAYLVEITNNETQEHREFTLEHGRDDGAMKLVQKIIGRIIRYKEIL